MEPSCSYHQLHQKQIIGTPISKSCKPLIAKDDYNLIVDCCLKVPYISHNWYRPIFGLSVYLTTEVFNPLKLSNWCISWRNFCTKKWMTYALISSSRSIDCRWKKIISVLVQKLTFLPEANFLTPPLKKEQRISSNFISNERTFKV